MEAIIRAPRSGRSARPMISTRRAGGVAISHLFTRTAGQQRGVGLPQPATVRTHLRVDTYAQAPAHHGSPPLLLLPLSPSLLASLISSVLYVISRRARCISRLLLLSGIGPSDLVSASRIVGLQSLPVSYGICRTSANLPDFPRVEADHHQCDLRTLAGQGAQSACSG